MPLPDSSGSAPTIAQPAGPPVVVIGGGIAGLYCARQLASHRVACVVLEAREESGGRIETGELLGLSAGQAHGLARVVKTEFGPMRFELEVQPYLDKLLRAHCISTDPLSPPDAPPIPIRYEMHEDELDKNGDAIGCYELLKLGILRMFGCRPVVKPVTKKGKTVWRTLLTDRDDVDWLQRLIDEPVDEEWKRNATGAPPQKGSFDNLRATATLLGSSDKPKLHTLSLWHALRHVLSPGAVDMI